MTTKVIDEDGNEIGTCSGYDHVRTDDGKGIHNQPITTIWKSDDFILKLTDFQRADPPHPSLGIISQLHADIRRRDLEIRDSERVIFALVRMMGGAVSLTNLDLAEDGRIEVEKLLDCTIIRAKEST